MHDYEFFYDLTIEFHASDIIMVTNILKKAKTRLNKAPSSWVQIFLAGNCTLLTALQISIYMSSMWPYLITVGQEPIYDFIGRIL